MNFTGNLIQAHILRDCVGRDQKRSPWGRLLPTLGNPQADDRDNNLYYLMPSGSLLSETYRGKSLSKQKFQVSEKSFNNHQRRGLFNILTRDIGISARSSKILVDRPVSHYRRIEEFVSGLVDSLWLANEQIFLFASTHIKLIRKLIRKIFTVGTYNLCDLVDQWKEWGNFLFHTMAETNTIGDLIKPKDNNIFNRLNSIPYISRVYRGERDMLLLQHVSHLVSSRQMPYMGSQTEKKSKLKFQQVLQSKFVPDEATVAKLGFAAQRIGRICKKIRPGAIPEGVSHISITNSGELSHSISKGAQAAAVKEALVRILTRVPEEDLEEKTPFGLVNHYCGVPIWKSLFRKEILDTEDEFLTPYFIIKEQEGRFRGLDEITGKQMMYVAWKELKPIPELRAEIVPEMGNKARFVTISAYWLNVLQAPLAHVLVDAIKWHPSVFSSFHRQDQAFEAVKGLVRLKCKALRSWEYVLSSDLKDATNAQQWSITIAMLRGFIEGYGLSFNSDYVDLVLGTIGPRLVTFQKEESILSSVGIMMGEAIAKPSLTLLNLSIEELAFLSHCNALDLLNTKLPSPYRDWRFIHIGGDDHLCRGPRSYLEAITKIHLSAGSHIDPGKHGFSRLAVKYTERVLNLENLQYAKAFDPDDYSHSTIVDSVKVRLLERGQSTMIKKDNKNVAIGKSTQLGGCLEWLPKDDRFYTKSKKESIRALFIERMGSLLPRKAVNPRAFASIHLPTSVGGFGLGMAHELEYFLARSPEPTQGLLLQAYMGLPIKQHLKEFRKLNCNTSKRGVENIQQFEQKIIDQLSDYPNMVNAITWPELKRKYPDENRNNKRIIAAAINDNILSFEEFAKRATRGTLFQNVLMGERNLSVFNTQPYVKTYSKVWAYAEDNFLLDWAGKYLTNDQIAIAIRNIAPQWFFDASQITCMDTGHWDPEDPDSETWDFTEDTYINKYRMGFPSFEIGFKLLGLRH